jgi:hypothetical protein
MTTEDGRARLRDLRSSFETLALANEGLSLLAQLPQPDDGAPECFTLRLVGAGSPEVKLRVQSNAADLMALSGSDRASAGKGEIHDSLGVELADGFAWDDSVCASADELAELLLKHMRRRLKAVGELLPQGDPDPTAPG